MKIVITGFMGSGKTMVARELARDLNLEMADLDERVTEREGKTPAQLIVDDGEEAFRSIESEVLSELLETGSAAVIALGGGAWIQEKNRALVNQHNCESIWLDVPFEICWGRIEASGEDRPLGKTRDQALALYDLRRPVYALAKIHIQTSEENLDDVVARIKSEYDRRQH